MKSASLMSARGVKKKTKFMFRHSRLLLSKHSNYLRLSLAEMFIFGFASLSHIKYFNESSPWPSSKGKATQSFHFDDFDDTPIRNVSKFRCVIAFDSVLVVKTHLESF
jgi:galactose-1-phosphate uridylyltransferase